MSEDFGSYLKHQREMRGIPLEEIAVSTKISIRLLKALEENRFEDLPGEVFIKGFIRSYGQVIGSNEDELVAAYLESAGKPQTPKPTGPLPEKSEPAVTGGKKTASPSPSSSPVAAIVGFGVALALIAAGVYWVTTKKAPSTSQPQSSSAPGSSVKVDNRLPDVPSPPPPSEPQAAEQDSAAETTENISKPEENGVSQPPTPAEKPAAERTAEAAAPTNAAQPNKNTVTVSEKSDIMKNLQDQTVSGPAESQGDFVAADTSLDLVIRVSENSWFNLTVDDQRDQDFILPAGGSKKVKARNSIVMTIGNRRATQLVLNQKELELPDSPDNVIRNFIVNAEQLDE